MSGSHAGWREVALGNIAEVRLGRQRSPKNHTGDHMRPYLRAANVTWNGLDLSDVKKMNFEPSEATVYELRPGDIVMSEASGSIGEAGKPALWRGEIAGCCLQNTLIRIRPSERVLPAFLQYRLLYQALSGGWANGVARGVGIHHLGAQRVAAWTFSLPSKDRQRRIVEDLELRLSHIASAERSIMTARAKLDRFHVALYASLESRAEASEKLGTLLTSPLTNGRSLRTLDGGFPVLRLTAIQGGRIDTTAAKPGAWTRDQAARFLVREDDFLVSRGNGSLHLLARGGLVGPNPAEVAFPDTMIRVRVDKDRVLPRYLRLVWDTPSVRGQIEARARTTAGIYKVSQADLAAIELPLLAREDQERYCDELERRLSLTTAASDAVVQSSRRSAHLRRLIMAKALHGSGMPGKEQTR